MKPVTTYACTLKGLAMRTLDYFRHFDEMGHKETQDELRVGRLLAYAETLNFITGVRVAVSGDKPTDTTPWAERIAAMDPLDPIHQETP